MQEEGLLFQALIYLLAAVITVPIAKRMGLGSVLGYLLAGIIIGPFVLGLIAEEGEDIMHFAEFGVVMMLFLIGLELRPSLLWKMRRSIFGLGGLQLLITALLIATIALFFDQSVSQAIAIGLILALSSTAIILQTLVERGLMKTPAGKSALSVLLLQDIAVIPILALLPLLALKTESDIVAKNAEKLNTIFGLEISGFVQVALILISITAIVITGKFLATYIFRIIAKTGLREIFTATALLIVIAISVVMEKVGLSPALGAFLGGVVLAENEYRHELEANIEPFKGLLLGLFFLAVGASINFNLLFDRTELVLAGLGILIAVKFGVLLSLGRLFGLRGGQGTLFSFALAQGGEFAFVLIAFSQQNSVLTDEISGVLLIVVALSMAMTPLLLLFNEKIIHPMVVTTTNIKTTESIESEGNKVVIAGFGRFGRIIGRLLIANGFTATILDSNPDNIEVLRKFGIKVYYGDATRPALLEAAGCAEADVMVIALDNKDRSLQVFDLVRQKYPHLKIISRAVSKPHAYEFLKRGIEDYDNDMLGSALESGKRVLHALGFTRYQAHRAARVFKHHERLFEKELFIHHGDDEKKYISESRRLSDELEELLREEKEQSIHEIDNAWDTSSRLEEQKKIRAEMEKGNSRKS